MKKMMNSTLKFKLCVSFCGNIQILIGARLDKQEDKIDNIYKLKTKIKKKTKKKLKNVLTANGNGEQRLCKLKNKK
jgi:hypothetical protein